MAVVVEVNADLTFEVEVPGREPVHGTISGGGTAFDVRVDDSTAFAGKGDAATIRAAAAALARQGVVVRVHASGAHLVSIGAVRAGWWQRRATRSRHIRLASLRGAWAGARSSLAARDVSVLPDHDLTPSLTLFPVAPTFMRRVRRAPGGTHAPPGGGSPRLTHVLAAGRPPGSPHAYALTEDLVTIGSDADCDIVLPGLVGRFAEIQHDERDEYVVVAVDGTPRVNGAPVRRGILRTGSRLQLGAVTLVFAREEFADHGRPYGGRVGGELGQQRSQPRPRDD